MNAKETKNQLLYVQEIKSKSSSPISPFQITPKIANYLKSQEIVANSVIEFHDRRASFCTQ
jgi:hypothetical protein